MNADLLVLVDELDNEIGSVSKLEAHTRGLQHRAFSVFIFNTRGELLLQQRAFNKYHSSGLWSNTCCSHPRPGETVIEAANRRLYEEMGMVCKLTTLFSFVYQCRVGGGLTEHEFDHVFVGVSDAAPTFNKMEVAGWRYLDMEKVRSEMSRYPDHFTEWFKICLTEHDEKFLKYLEMQ